MVLEEFKNLLCFIIILHPNMAAGTTNSSKTRMEMRTVTIVELEDKCRSEAHITKNQGVLLSEMGLCIHSSFIV